MVNDIKTVKGKTAKQKKNFRKSSELKVNESNKIKAPKCYNSVSCVLSVLIIIFVVGSIFWDNFITKPQIRHEINEIKIEIKNINTKLLNKADIPNAEKTICDFECADKKTVDAKTCE